MSDNGPGKINCPACGHSSTFVVNSRGAYKMDAVRRRRQCKECGEKFTTMEFIVPSVRGRSTTEGLSAVFRRHALSEMLDVLDTMKKDLLEKIAPCPETRKKDR